jgi:hypothetical protein
MAQELSWYLNDASALLRDSSNIFTSTKQLTRWINEARRDIAKINGCIRCLIAGTSPVGNSALAGTAVAGAALAGQDLQTSFATIPGVEMYPYDYANPYLRAQNAGVDKICGVLDVSVSWGATRPTLNRMAWGDLQALARSYNVGVTSYPFVWASQGDGTRGKVFLFPVPSVGGIINGEMEWDVIAIPSPLYSNDDYDAIPDSFQDAVKFRATALALMASSRFTDARIFDVQFLTTLGVDRASAQLGSVADYYWQTDLP